MFAFFFLYLWFIISVRCQPNNSSDSDHGVGNSTVLWEQKEQRFYLEMDTTVKCVLLV